MQDGFPSPNYQPANNKKTSWQNIKCRPLTFPTKTVKKTLPPHQDLGTSRFGLPCPTHQLRQYLYSRRHHRSGKITYPSHSPWNGRRTLGKSGRTGCIHSLVRVARRFWTGKHRTGRTKRNVRSICVDNINFHADKDFIYETGRNCILNRSKWKFRHSSSRYTAEQRLKLAQDYLESHPLLKVGDYSELTGLLRNAAAQELKQWSEMPESGIGHTGRGSHKIYIKETPQNQED